MALARAGPAPDAPCRPPQRTLSQMDPTLFWYVVATVLVLVGLAGVILPALPGLPLVFIGMLVAAWAGDFERIGVVHRCVRFNRLRRRLRPRRRKAGHHPLRTCGRAVRQQRGRGKLAGALWPVGQQRAGCELCSHAVSLASTGTRRLAVGGIQSVAASARSMAVTYTSASSNPACTR